MTTLHNLAYAASAVVALAGAMEQARLDWQFEASRQIEPGDTEAEVRAVLGRPLVRWKYTGLSRLVFGPPQWAYGAIIDLGGIVSDQSLVPCPLSVKLRIFGPDVSDLVVTWDADGRVASITRP